MAIEVKWGFVLTARKGLGEVASSVIGNVRAERDDCGLVDVAGREAFVACVQGRARGVRAPEELREPVAVHNDRRAPPLPPLSIINFADVKLRRLAVARRPVVADVDELDADLRHFVALIVVVVGVELVVARLRAAEGAQRLL